jgi:RimJ/RimL family protein N-acetyltransferase
MEQHFATVGCTATRIEVWVPNEGARTFYERIGYEEADLDLRKELR